MRLPDNAYVIVDFSVVKDTSVGYVLGVILDKDFKSSMPYLSFYHDRKSSDDLIIQIRNKSGKYITVDWLDRSLPKCGNVLTAGRIDGRFPTYWHHGAYDRQICKILEQHHV